MYILKQLFTSLSGSVGVEDICHLLLVNNDRQSQCFSFFRYVIFKCMPSRPWSWFILLGFLCALSWPVAHQHRSFKMLFFRIVNSLPSFYLPQFVFPVVFPTQKFGGNLLEYLTTQILVKKDISDNLPSNRFLTTTNFALQVTSIKICEKGKKKQQSYEPHKWKERGLEANIYQVNLPCIVE